VVGVQREGAAATLDSRDPPTDDCLVIKWLEIQPNSTQYVILVSFEAC
jgi:hypothetical protein